MYTVLSEHNYCLHDEEMERGTVITEKANQLSCVDGDRIVVHTVVYIASLQCTCAYT